MVKILVLFHYKHHNFDAFFTQRLKIKTIALCNAGSIFKFIPNV